MFSVSCSNVSWKLFECVVEVEIKASCLRVKSDDIAYSIPSCGVILRNISFVADFIFHDLAGGAV